MDVLPAILVVSTLMTLSLWKFTKDGASAAGIYGAAAGNGAVLITTKKGKGNGKITYDFQYTSQSLGKVPEVMNAAQYKDFLGKQEASQVLLIPIGMEKPIRIGSMRL